MTDHEETAREILEPLYVGAEFDVAVRAVAAALAQAEAEGAKGPWNKCPRCDSPNAHLHPAVQYEGEVQPCSHPFHIPAEITRLKAENLRLSHEGLLVEKQAAEAERDYFRARLAEVERERGCGCKTSEQTGTLNGYMCEWHREKYLQVCADRDAAEAKGVSMGLERAREIATDFSKPYEIDWWMTKTKKEISAIMCLDVADAIDAEIAKAGKEK